ncbi:MAG: DUF6152 family protein [Rhodospirillaceae bacterium]|nr:DUF6152 family protein [Rhodospirillaceae bacterium]
MALKHLGASMKSIAISVAKVPAASVILAAAAALTAAPLSAHHSISRHYDRTHVVKVEGVVTEGVLQNPHAKIHLAVKDASGMTTAWLLEWDDVSDLRRQDVDANTIRAGDEIIVTGIAAWEGRYSLYIERIDRPADGLVYLDD